MTPTQKTIKYLAMGFAIFLIVSIVTSIIGVFGLLGNIFDGDEAVGDMKEYEITGEITDIQIDISAAELDISSGDAFAVESNLKNLKVEEKDGRLIITEKSRFGFDYDGPALKITVPAGFKFSSADISTGAGRLTANRIAADRLELELGAGEAVIDEIIAEVKADIDGGAGKLTVNGGSMKDLDLDMGVGKVEFESRLWGECDLDHGVGGAEIVLLGNEEDYRIRIDKGLGGASVNGSAASDGSVFGDGETKVNIDGGVGEIKVEFKEDK